MLKLISINEMVKPLPIGYVNEVVNLLFGQ